MRLNTAAEGHPAFGKHLCVIRRGLYKALDSLPFCVIYFIFLVNFIIHLQSLPRVLKANIFRADAYIAISSFWKYLFTTCCVLHTGETNMSKASSLP